MEGQEVEPLWLELITFNPSLPTSNTATSHFAVRLLHRVLGVP
jgi:hypothetical protein